MSGMNAWMIGSFIVALVCGWAWLMVVRGEAEPAQTTRIQLLRKLLAPPRRFIQRPHTPVNKVDRFKARLRRSG